MKYDDIKTKVNTAKSRPARGAWVEITIAGIVLRVLRSRPARGAWVEIALLVVLVFITTSRPARGAWVEISTAKRSGSIRDVAPRKGRVG